MKKPHSAFFTINESQVMVRKNNCPMCGADKPSLLYEADNPRRNLKKIFPVSKCIPCGFVYCDIVPDDESIAMYYKNEPTHSPSKLSLAEKIYYNLFRKIPVEKGKILDVGCNDGKFLRHIKPKGYEVVGSDLYGLDDFKSTTGISIHKGQLYDIGFESGSFDAVCFWGSLEHVQKPLRNLQEAHRILKTGGHIIVWTLNVGSFEAQIFKRYWHHLYVPEHFSIFSDKSLKDMIENAGFAQTRIRYDLLSFGFVGSLQGWLHSKNLILNFHNLFTNILALPFDIFASICNKSGMITAYSQKK